MNCYNYYDEIGKLERPDNTHLTYKQHLSLVYRFGILETYLSDRELDEYNRDRQAFRDFVWELEHFSFISPNERKYYLRCIEIAEQCRNERHEEFLERMASK